MLELSESSFRLNGTVATKQLSLFGGNILVRLLTHLLKFPADVDLFSPVLIFCLAADRTIRQSEQSSQRETETSRTVPSLAYSASQHKDFDTVVVQ